MGGKEKKTRSRQRSRQRWHLPAVGAGILVFFAVFSAVAWRKYGSFSFGDIDLALLNQTAWNAAHGFLAGGAPGHATVFNGGHVFIVLILLAPTYALMGSPLFLLTLQALALGLGAWPVYLLARKILGDPFGLIFGLAYLVFPAMNFVCLYEFHPIALTTPLLLGAAWALVSGRRWGYWLLVGLALSCREDAAIPVAALGIFAVIQARELRSLGAGRQAWVGLGTIAVAAVWFAVCLKAIQPAFRPAVIDQTSASQAGMAFFSWLGNSPQEIAVNLLTHPLEVVSAVFTGPKLLYLLHLLVPVAFLAVFSPAGMAALLVSLAEGLLSQRFSHYSIHYQYSSIITPLVFLGSIFGARNLLRVLSLPTGRRVLAGAVIIASVLSAWFFGPLFELPQGWRTWAYTREDAVRDRMVDAVPAAAPVIASFAFTPKLSSRPWLFYFYHLYAFTTHPDFRPEIPPAREKAEWILVDFDDWLTFYDFYTPGGDESVREFLREGRWRLAASVNSLALFRRGETYEPGVVEAPAPAAGEEFRPVPGLPGLEIGAVKLDRGEELGFPVARLSAEFMVRRAPLPDLLPVVLLTGPSGSAPLVQQALMAPYRIYPSYRWRAGERVRLRANILLPPGASGSYDLRLLALARRSGTGLNPALDTAMILNYLPRQGIAPAELLVELPLYSRPGALKPD
ncbi:MAG TPA: DUF2079 domain-containing protein [bacterium]|nr:DUF2079 domain-containing protein [bacterium]